MPKLYTFLKYFCVILWSCFVIAPFLWAISTSFKDFNSVTGGATYIPWLQFEPTLDGWSVLFKPGSQGGINIVGPYFNSIFVTFTASFISIALGTLAAVSYTHLRAHETRHDLVCRLLLEKKKMKSLFLLKMKR